MPIRSCPSCGQKLLFEARTCEGCFRPVLFDPASDDFAAFDEERAEWLDHAKGIASILPCRNSGVGVCNWAVDGTSVDGRCRACSLNRIIPDLSVPGVLERWRRIEEAKRRMVYGLIRLGLPIEPDAYRQPIVFDFLYDPAAEIGGVPQLTTGHAGGVITMNIIEADDAARERIRRALREPYRTLLGHFRHEIAHYYWHRLVEPSPDIWRFRALFGDESTDYARALARHYEGGARAGWEGNYISAYATMHPWEDFAETFAHYLHIVDTLATINDAGMGFPRAVAIGPFERIDPYFADIPAIVEQWIPTAFALNEVNRSMGQRDLYPFSLSPGVMLKLDFVHRMVAFAAGRWAPGENESADLRALIAALGHGVQQVRGQD